MSRFKLVVFDCDGTLVDSQHLIVSAMQRAFMGEGLLSPERTAVLHTVGLSVFEAVCALSPSSEPDMQARLAASYRDWCMTLRQQGHTSEPMFAGASAALRRLAAQERILLGIATGKSRRGVVRLVEAEGLGGMFATIQTADDAPSKPHPAMLQQAMAETGAEPGHTYMIGDSVFDIAMAISAGVTPIGVSWGYHRAVDLERAGARHIARNFSDLAQLLDIENSPALVAAE